MLRYCVRYPWLALLVALALTAVAWQSTRHLTIQTNFVDLLPDDQPEVQELRHLQKIVGGASFVIVTVEPDRPDLGPALLEALAQRLAGHGDIRYLDYRPPYDFFRRNALLYLGVDELDKFAERITRRIDQIKLGQLLVDLRHPEEQIGLADLENQYRFIRHQYYQNDAGSLFVMLIKPQARATDIGRTKALLHDLRAAIRTTRAQLGPDAGDAHVTVRLTGPYVKALAQTAHVKADATRVGIFSLLGMAVIIGLYFARKRALFLIAVPLGVGLVWTLGIAAWLYGSLNFFTSIVCAILLGLAADYGIHLFSHYCEQRRAGHDLATAMHRMHQALFTPMWLAAITTMAAFFALGLSDFKPMYQFGVIAGIGICCTLVAIFFLLPALTAVCERVAPLRFERPSSRLADLAALALPRLIRPRGLLITSACIGVLVVPILMGGVQFDYNFANIMGAQNTRDLDARIDRIFNYSINPEIARASSPEDAGAYAAALRRTRDALRKTPQGSTIQTAIALADFVPKDQAAKLARIAQLRAQFTEAVVALMPPTERARYDDMQSALQPAPIHFEDLPEALLTKFVDLEGNLGRFLYIFPSFNRQDGRELEQFVQEVAGVRCPECRDRVVVTGESVVFYEIVNRLLQESRWVIFASLAAIALALLVVFRSTDHALRCFVPLGLALLGTLGLMGLFGIRFTIVNLAAIPVLLGAGIDYAIYFYQQVRQDGQSLLLAAYRTTTPPIIGSSVTTMLGFGVLLAADNRGVQSFGAIVAIGIFMCAFTTLVWFPGWLVWLEKRNNKRSTQILEQRPAKSLQ